MTSAFQRFSEMRQAARRPFVRRANESPSLQFIVLLMGWWVAASLAWSGAPPLVWLGGSLLLTAGHAFSWTFRDFKSPFRSGIVALALVGSLAIVPSTVMKAINGDWLPVAFFLVLFQAIASFEMRTRGGLYASIIISGAIFFFVSQQALDIAFVIFLTGFTTLLLSFMALSYLIDQVRDADVRWFQNRFSFTWFWTSIFVASMLTSALIFFMMPKKFADPINNAQGAILPMRASDSLELPEVSFEQGSVASALPLTSTTSGGQQQALPNSGGPQAGGSAGQGTGASDPNSGIERQSTSGEGIEGGSGFGNQTMGSGGLSQDATIGGMDEPDLIDSLNGDPLIMQVRSPVLTYWRDRTFDTFDGQVWHEDNSAWFLRSSGSSRAVYTAPQPRDLRLGPLYNQTFYIKRRMPIHTFMTGYAPLVASIPFSLEGIKRLEDGSVYRVISSLPDFTLDNLRNSPPSSRLEYRFHQIPESQREIEFLASQVTEGAFTDVDRMQQIVTYIDRNYEYDVSAHNNLELTAEPLEFLEEQSTGTSMDIATATVLLARGSGIPARLVTGYLPGRLDPLSGTYLVHASDRHAWAEVFFSEFGWVPFDSAPRPSTEQYGEGGTFFDQPLVNELFSSDYSENLYDSITSSPQLLSDVIDNGLGETIAAVVAPMVAISIFLLAAFALWRFGPSMRNGGNGTQYAQLAGVGRSEVLQVYLGAERELRRAGLSQRRPSETLSEYTQDVESNLGDSASDLEWLRKAAWNAAYDPSPHDSGVTTEAKRRLLKLKAALKIYRENNPEAKSNPDG